jgi:hypothetical protein
VTARLTEELEREATMGTEDTPIPGPLNNVVRIDDERIKGHGPLRLGHGGHRRCLRARRDCFDGLRGLRTVEALGRVGSSIGSRFMARHRVI